MAKPIAPQKNLCQRQALRFLRPLREKIQRSAVHALREALFCAGLLGALMGPAQAATVVLSPSKDTWLNQANPNFNYGAATQLSASHPDASSGLAKTALLHFDLSVIPANQRITSARLRLKVSDGSRDTLLIRRMIDNDGWPEGAQSGAPAATLESSYNLRAAPATAWVAQSATQRPAYDASLFITVDTDYDNGARFDEDVTELIRPLHANQSAGNGLLINVSSADIFSFASRESANAADRPQLSVSYEPVESHHAWLFQETSWSGVSGEVKNSYTDRHGTALAGTSNSNATPPKAASRYASFDGRDDAIAVNKDASLDVSGSYTVMFWMRLPPQSNNAMVLDHGDNFSIELIKGALLFKYKNTAGQTRILTSVNDPVPNQWAHYALVRDAASNSYRAYISHEASKRYVEPYSLRCDGVAPNPADRPCFYNDTPRTNSGRELRLGNNAAGTEPYLGLLDDVRLYSRALSRGEVLADALRTPSGDGGTALAGFQISHDGTGANCTPEPITIKAIDSSGALLSDYTGTISLSTSTGHGSWAKDGAAGALSSGNNTGAASYSFVHGDRGIAVLSLANPHIERLSIQVSDGALREDPAFDPPLLFTPSSLRITANDSPTLPTQVAAKPFSGGPFRLEAIDGSCAALIDSASQSVELAIECLDPGSCTEPLRRNGAPLALNNAGTVSSYSAVNLAFSGGKADLGTLSFADVGLLKLHARASFDVNGTPLLLSGASAAFVVRPFAFDLEIPGNPAASSVNGNRFKRAGEAFSARLRAVAWQAGDDADNDGAADLNADLGNNPLTPAFGRHLSAPPTVLKHALIDPAGGAPGVLSGGGSVGLLNEPGALGSKTLTLSWSEVGIIGLQASLDNYLGGGQRTSGNAAHVGRFYPADFAITLTTQGACGSSSYAGLPALTAQPFSLSGSITARNLNGDTTRNYVGSYAKLGVGTLSLEDFEGPAPGNSPAEAGAATPNFMAARFSDGVSPLASLGPSYSFYGLRAPYSVGFEVTASDSDGVTGRSPRSAPLDFRVGRLRLDSVGGPYDQDLNVPLSADYFDGANWRSNPLDSCTDWNSSSSRLSDYRDNLEAGDTEASGGGRLSAGRAQPGVSLRAPGADNTGSARLHLDLTQTGNFLPWLRHDWDNDGSLDPGPSATINFGQYRGSDRVIYWKETQ